MRSSTNSLSQTNCFYNAVEKVNCQDTPASCLCAKPHKKKSRKVAEALTTCAAEKCDDGWRAELNTLHEFLCLTEQTKSSCGPKTSCPADRDCIRFPDERRRCALKKSSCQNELDCNFVYGERCVEGSCYIPAGTKALGDTCSGAECGERLLCDSGKCKTLDQCSSSNDCYGSMKCFDGSCRGPGQRGEVCRGTLDCAGALVCSSGVCKDRVLLPPGASCISSLQCGSADCTADGVCGEYWDGKCANDSDCRSGYWCYDVPGGTNCCPMNTPADDECRSHV